MLTDANITKMGEYLGELDAHIKTLNNSISNAKTQLQGNLCKVFKENYTQGKKAATNIETIIKIVESQVKDLTKLKNDAVAYHATVKKASGK